MDPSFFDPALVGFWPDRPAYGAPPPDGRLSPERKAADLPEDGDLRLLLNDMTAEMRAQFDAFRALREFAGLSPGEADEAAGKLARADLKAATDAMSLIVRTLEKVDALQRQMARDRREAEETKTEPQGYDEARRHFLALVERRAEERARILFDAWLRDGTAAVDGSGDAASLAGGEGGD